MRWLFATATRCWRFWIRCSALDAGEVVITGRRRKSTRLAAAAAPLPVTVLVHVDLDRETLRHIDAFKEAMRERAEVQQCWYTSGLTDFILVARVESLARYKAFTREALISQDNVARFTRCVVLGEVKCKRLAILSITHTHGLTTHSSESLEMRCVRAFGLYSIGVSERIKMVTKRNSNSGSAGDETASNK